MTDKWQKQRFLHIFLGGCHGIYDISRTGESNWNIFSNGEYAALFGLDIPKDLKLKAVGLACGTYSFPDVDDTENIGDHLTDYFGDVSLLNDERTKVLDHITSAYPPAFAFSS